MPQEHGQAPSAAYHGAPHRGHEMLQCCPVAAGFLSKVEGERVEGAGSFTNKPGAVPIK